MQPLKTIFHVHTDYSADSDMPLETLLAEARARGVGCLTITDHDTISGARAAAAMAGPDLQIIIGEEITTNQGHLIGLFLREHIEPYQTARRTAELIHRQGGVVVVPHPFNRLFDCSLREAVYDMIDLADAIEVSNAQNCLPWANRQALALATRFKLPMMVGVDAHHAGSLDACYQWVPRFDGPRGFVRALGRARQVTGRHPASYFLKTAWATLLDRCGMSLPEGYGRKSPYRRPELSPIRENA
jgi:predicted metal-dependent phosphoesterase TrpH